MLASLHSIKAKFIKVSLDSGGLDKLLPCIHPHFYFIKPNLASLVFFYFLSYSYFTWLGPKLCFLTERAANCSRSYLSRWARGGVSVVVSTPHAIWIANHLCNSKVMQWGTLAAVIFLHLGAWGRHCRVSAVIVSVLGVTPPYCRDGRGLLPQPPPL